MAGGFNSDSQTSIEARLIATARALAEVQNELVAASGGEAPVESSRPERAGYQFYLAGFGARPGPPEDLREVIRGHATGTARPIKGRLHGPAGNVPERQARGFRPSRRQGQQEKTRPASAPSGRQRQQESDRRRAIRAQRRLDHDPSNFFEELHMHPDVPTIPDWLFDTGRAPAERAGKTIPVREQIFEEPEEEEDPAQHLHPLGFGLGRYTELHAPGASKEVGESTRAYLQPSKGVKRISTWNREARMDRDEIRPVPSKKVEPTPPSRTSPPASPRHWRQQHRGWFGRRYG